MSNEKQQELKLAVQNLEKNIEKFPSDSCEKTVLGVLKHTEVQDAVRKLLDEEYDFYNYECRDIGFIPGQIFMVTLFFRCRPPKMCFVAPLLEIVYDRPEDKVLYIKESFT